MTRPIPEFSQNTYNKIVHSLDDVVAALMDFEKTEEEAQAWLIDFIKIHYFPVWRAIKPFGEK